MSFIKLNYRGADIVLDPQTLHDFREQFDKQSGNLTFIELMEMKDALGLTTAEAFILYNTFKPKK